MAWPIPPVAVAAITACVVLAGVGAASALRLDDGRRMPTVDGPGVSIAVVDPREPVPVPGSVMEVGELADGYKHRPYVRQAAYESLPYDDFEGYPPAPAEPRRVERPREVAYEPPPPPVIVERREGPRRWSFGFDQPRPDYAAERRERMARMEDQRRVDEERMRYRSDDRYRPDDRYRDDRRELSVRPDDRGPDAYPNREPRERERQWYRRDGGRVSGPETFY